MIGYASKGLIPFLSGIIVALVGVALSSQTLRSDDTTKPSELPDYLKLLSASPSQTASKNVLVLDKAMFTVYDAALAKFQQNIKNQRPILIARFTGEGGDMTLYRPGKEPIVAPPVPIAYQYVKSCGHSAMAIYQLTVPYLGNTSDQAWRRPMEEYLGRCKAAYSSLKDLKVSDDDRKLLDAILKNNIDFMETSLKNGKFTLKELEAFAKTFKPLAEKAIAVAAENQVSHWMQVVEDWKKLLGKDWDQLLAATNTIYVTRQNNILFSVLVQYMGTDAINKRLMLFETTEFVTTKEQMLSLLTRIVADRSLGQLYFGDYYLMDYELLGSGARKVIEEQCKKRSMSPHLPTLAPFNSTQWPWHTDPKSGTGPATLEQIK